MLLGGTLWGTMSRCGQVIDEGMVWKRAGVEVGLVGCVEGGSFGVEVGFELGVI